MGRIYDNMYDIDDTTEHEWVENTPTMPGWYWYAQSLDSEPVIIEVTVGQELPAFGLWCGPLYLPPLTQEDVDRCKREDEERNK